MELENKSPFDSYHPNNFDSRRKTLMAAKTSSKSLRRNNIFIFSQNGSIKYTY